MQDSLEHNKKTVLRFLDAMSNGDAEQADQCVGPNAFTLAKGFGKFAGRRERATMVGTIAAFKELLPTGLNIAVGSVTAEGSRVVVEFEGNAKTCEGLAYHNQYCMVFTLQDGLISQVNEYFCNIHADEVMWPLLSTSGQ